MRVRVLMFAGLKERTGCSELRLEDLPDDARVGDVVAEVERRWPELRGFPMTMACNRQVATADTALVDNAELALLPPVSGGVH